MSEQWTYKFPDEERYRQATIITLKEKEFTEFADILQYARITYYQWSTVGRRSLTFWVTINFNFTLSYYQKASDYLKTNPDDHIAINRILDDLMPYEAGFDVENFSISLDLERDDVYNGISTEIEKAVQQIPDSLKSAIIPEDFKEKMREMAEFYSYLYLVENSLRLFVLKIIEDNYGDQELSNITLLPDQNKKIRDRKGKESVKKWMRVRGDSDIYYLDFTDILTIIRMNWIIFKNSFESQNWISVKLDELRDCRHVVAHNGYLGEIEKGMILTNYQSIIQQISMKISP